ncbi:uncharacterized protein LOC135338846 [Halichondria panicea]|uniref:uncharacterized protein LOC135338846 n=1 Tax=Halichondria panicea TaxID=6063 RepID=UPI00312BA123
MNASVESLVLIKYYDKLQTMIQGEIVSMSTKALSQHLLSSGEHSKCIHMIYTNEQKAMFFMQAIKNRVDVDSACFGTFLGVLKQEPSYKFMTDKLEKEVEERKNKRPGSETGADYSPQPSIGATINADGGDSDDFLSVDNTTVLDNEDCFDVVEEVSDLAVRFIQLGKALRLVKADMDIIQSKHKDEPKAGLYAVIETWLQHNHAISKHGVPTWRVLVKAVAHPYGGSNCALARKIAANHLSSVGQASS